MKISSGSHQTVSLVKQPQHGNSHQTESIQTAEYIHHKLTMIDLEKSMNIQVPDFIPVTNFNDPQQLIPTVTVSSTRFRRTMAGIYKDGDGRIPSC